MVDFLELMPDLTALENVFIDSVPTSATCFVNYYASFMDEDSTRIYDYKLDLIVNQVLSRCPNQLEARPVKVYVRCVTYDEVSCRSVVVYVLLIADIACRKLSSAAQTRESFQK